MARTFTLSELVNLAIGTPELGVCNFNALHALLHGMLEHFQIGEVQKMVGDVESEFIKPRSPETIGTAEAPEATGTGSPKAGENGRSVSLFHQLEEKVAKLQNALDTLSQLPTVPELLARSQAETPHRKFSAPGSSTGPVKDMWQLMQVKKKVEANEEGVHKAMTTLQELMNAINHLTSVNESLRKELDKANQSKAQNSEEMSHRLNSILEQLNNVPEEKNVVLWDTLQIMLNKELSFDEKINMLSLQSEVVPGEMEGAKQAATQRLGPALAVLHKLTLVSTAHYVLKDRVDALEEELKRQMEEIDKKGLPDDLLMRLDLLDNGLQIIQNETTQDRELIAILKRKLEEMEEDVEGRLAILQADHDDLQGIHEKLDQLEEKKVDKEFLEMEINGKADKKALESKVSRTLLDATAQQLNAMMQELLNKVCAQEKDWQKVLEKLLCDMDCKLDRMELDPLKKQLEERWKHLKKQLRSGPGFEADSAAGFRKQLLERFKCISCAKSTRIMPGPQLITIAASALHPRIRPTTAPELDSLKQQRGIHNEYYDNQWSRNSNRPCGGVHTVTGPVGRRNSRNLNLQTVYQYGDPNPMYRREEVELQGIDGVMYKGRLDPKLPIIHQMQDEEPLERKSNGIKQYVSRQETFPVSPKCVYCNQTCMPPRAVEPCLTQLRPLPQEISNVCRCLAALCPLQQGQEVGNINMLMQHPESPCPKPPDQDALSRCPGRGPVKVFCPAQNAVDEAARPVTSNCNTKQTASPARVTDAPSSVLPQ
ncbi:glutamine-rich protein 2-like isoform X2 [Heterodontus francisci]|uniref:glutamine-rich protein 2-like isoform X2 n=1 Tax=Heterodontus francisci TaxID=7792 RepID=UPI00355B3E30